MRNFYTANNIEMQNYLLMLTNQSATTIQFTLYIFMWIINVMDILQ